MDFLSRLQSKIIALPDLGRWRNSPARADGPLALVTGTFDLIQPGNLSAIEEARRRVGAVCLVVEPDDVAASRMGPGRPQHSLAERAELASHLEAVEGVTSFAPAQASQALAGLRPYTWVTCRDHRKRDPLAGPAAAAAGQVLELPAIPGCFTEEIQTAIRTDRTPIRLPPGHGECGCSSPPADASRPSAGTVDVTVNGCFDILHIGHVRFLAQARALGDELTVLINDDESVRKYKGPTRPVFPLPFRREALLALESVDRVRAFSEDDPLRLLAEIRPRIHVKGGSYEEERVRDERRLVEGWGGRLAFCEMVDGYSTSDYIRKVLGIPAG